MEMKVLQIRYEFTFKNEEFGQIDIASLTTDLTELGYTNVSVNREIRTVQADLPFASDTEGLWLQTEHLFNKKYGLSVGGEDVQ